MKYHVIFLIGFFLSITPFVGVPTAWKMVAIGLIGAGLMIAALIKYYAAYSSQELNQTHTDGGPENNPSSDGVLPANEELRATELLADTQLYTSSTNSATIVPTESPLAQPSPSPYYEPKKTRVQRRKKEIIKDDAANEDEDEDDSDDVAYMTKNKHEEEHAF